MSLDPKGCHALLVDIVYHAQKDLEALRVGGDEFSDYVDDDHRAFCNSRGFVNGEEELVTFFRSHWFRHICDNFVDITADEILTALDV